MCTIVFIPFPSEVHKIDIWKALDSDNCEIYGDNLKWMWLDASLNKSDSILIVAEFRHFPFNNE